MVLTKKMSCLFTIIIFFLNGSSHCSSNDDLNSETKTAEPEDEQQEKNKANQKTKGYSKQLLIYTGLAFLPGVVFITYGSGKSKVKQRKSDSSIVLPNDNRYSNTTYSTLLNTKLKANSHTDYAPFINNGIRTLEYLPNQSFVQAILYCLIYLPSLSNFFHSKSYNIELNHDFSNTTTPEKLLFESFVKLIYETYKKTPTPISLNPFISHFNNPKLHYNRCCNRLDAANHFLRFLLNILSKGTQSENKSFYYNMFEFGSQNFNTKPLIDKFKSELCSNSPIKKEFGIITLLKLAIYKSILPRFEIEKYLYSPQFSFILSLPIRGESGFFSTLDECLRSYFFSSKKRSHSLHSAPSTLIVELNKNNYHPSSKILPLKHLVSFTTKNFNLAPYIATKQEEPIYYQLFAVINYHKVDSTYPYTAFIKGREDYWHHCQGSGGTTILPEEKKIVTKNAVMLFYIKSIFASV